MASPHWPGASGSMPVTAFSCTLPSCRCCSSTALSEQHGVSCWRAFISVITPVVVCFSLLCLAHCSSSCWTEIRKNVCLRRLLCPLCCGIPVTSPLTANISAFHQRKFFKAAHTFSFLCFFLPVKVVGTERVLHAYLNGILWESFSPLGE